MKILTTKTVKDLVDFLFGTERYLHYYKTYTRPTKDFNLKRIYTEDEVTVDCDEQVGWLFIEGLTDEEFETLEFTTKETRCGVYECDEDIRKVYKADELICLDDLQSIAIKH